MTQATVALGGEDELVRLHGVARTAALQTGATGALFDATIADVLRVLLLRSNEATFRNLAKPTLRVVE